MDTTCRRFTKQLDIVLLLLLAGNTAILSARIALAQPSHANRFRIIVENQPTSLPRVPPFPAPNQPGNQRWTFVLPQSQNLDPCVSRRGPPCTKCPRDYAVLVPRGRDKIKLTWDSPYSCNRERVRQTYGPVSGSEFAEGTHHIQYEISNDCGVLAYCQFHILVRVRRCSSFNSPDQGSFVCNLGTAWGSTCSFSCEPGYELCGSKQITCVEFGNYLIWSRKLPMCKTPDEVEASTDKNEVSILPDTTANKFFTDTEFITWPTTITESPLPFIWSTTEANPLTSPPKEPECPTISEIAFGRFRCNNGNLPLRPGTICQYVCNHGYTMLSGDGNLQTRHCQDNYEWNVTKIPECKATFCPEPLIIENGYMSCDNPITNRYFPGTICEYYCIEDYHIPHRYQEYNIRKCLEDGLWNNTKIPECKEIECPDPPVLKHGKMVCTPDNGRYWPQVQCDYSCKEGFIMKNPENKIISCDDDAKWTSTDIPKCEALQCPSPINPPNSYLICKPEGLGTYLPGMSCDVTCFHGYKMWHQEHRTWKCDISGFWKKTGNSICEVILCSKPPNIKNGHLSCDPQVKDTFPLGAKCKHVCNKGYNLSPESQKFLTCEASGLWNPANPATCQSKQCRKLPKVKNAKLICNVPESKFYPVNTVCKYECLDGFFIQQMHQHLRVRICDSTVNWNVTGKPRCAKQAKPCKQPPIPVNGKLNCTNQPVKDKYEARTKCEFSCEDGYVIPTTYLKHKYRQCDNFGKWNTSKMPYCKKASAPRSDECFNQINILDPEKPLIIRHPKFVTDSGRPVEVNCSIDELSDAGIYENICLATDPELRVTGSCIYTIILKKSSKCKINAPTNSELSCQAEPEICEMKCKDSRTMLLNNKLIKSFSMECLENGKWDFETKPQASLPDCVRLLPKTSLKVGMHFNLEISSCKDTNSYVELRQLIQNKLLEENSLCGDIDCTDYDTECIAGQPGGDLPVTDMINVNWNVVATYEPETEDNIPQAEQHINIVLDTTAELMQSEAFQKELQKSHGILRKNSWHFTRVELVCTEMGFIADADTLRCYECGTGMYHEEKSCIPCPMDEYQDETGKTECKLCPANHGTNSEGSRYLSNCSPNIAIGVRPS